VLSAVDDKSREYFIESRLQGDHSKVEPLLANCDNPETIKSTCEKARAKLQLVEMMLKYAKSTFGSDGLWLTGGKPSHADAMVFGWYAFCRMNPELIKGVWEHESLPNIGEWLKGCKGLINESDLP
jgi:glutathione S-transferase